MNQKNLAVIEEYATLKIRVARAETRIEEIKDDFYEACDASVKEGQRVVNLSESKLSSEVVIKESKTRGIWDYPSEITRLEDKVKVLKKIWQEEHNAVGGNVRTWIVEVMNKISNNKKNGSK